jgi:hypothetical protein
MLIFNTELKEILDGWFEMTGLSLFDSTEDQIDFPFTMSLLTFVVDPLSSWFNMSLLCFYLLCKTSFPSKPCGVCPALHHLFERASNMLVGILIFHIQVVFKRRYCAIQVK